MAVHIKNNKIGCFRQTVFQKGVILESSRKPILSLLKTRPRKPCNSKGDSDVRCNSHPNQVTSWNQTMQSPCKIIAGGLRHLHLSSFPTSHKNIKLRLDQAKKGIPRSLVILSPATRKALNCVNLQKKIQKKITFQLRKWFRTPKGPILSHTMNSMKFVILLH